MLNFSSLICLNIAILKRIIHLILSNLILNFGLLRFIGVIENVITDLGSEVEVLLAGFIHQELAYRYPVHAGDKAQEQHHWLQGDVLPN